MEFFPYNFPVNDPHDETKCVVLLHNLVCFTIEKGKIPSGCACSTTRCSPSENRVWERPGKWIGKEHSQHKTNLCLKSDDTDNALHATAMLLSPECAPLFNARYLSMKVTLQDGSLKSLNVEGLLPTNSRLSSTGKFESIAKEANALLRVHHWRHGGRRLTWLADREKPDKQTLINLIGGVRTIQCVDITMVLTCWKYSMMFEVHYPHNSGEVVAIAKEFMSGTIGVERNLDAMIADQIGMWTHWEKNEIETRRTKCESNQSNTSNKHAHLFMGRC